MTKTVQVDREIVRQAVSILVEDVMVRHWDRHPWLPRYFSCELKGKAYCFSNGWTSWQTKDIQSWPEMRQPTPEELEDAK